MIFMSLSASRHDQFLRDFPRHILTVKSKQSLVIWLLPFTAHVFITAQTDSLYVSSADVRSMPHTEQQEAAQCNTLEVVYITLRRERKVHERHIVILTHDPDLCASGCRAAVHMFQTLDRGREAALTGVWQETSRL